MFYSRVQRLTLLWKVQFLTLQNPRSTLDIQFEMLGLDRWLWIPLQYIIWFKPNAKIWDALTHLIWSKSNAYNAVTFPNTIVAPSPTMWHLRDLWLIIQSYIPQSHGTIPALETLPIPTVPCENWTWSKITNIWSTCHLFWLNPVAQTWVSCLLIEVGLCLVQLDNTGGWFKCEWQ